jgi:replicative DNA helicase
MKAAEKPLPYNADAERAILAAGILDNKAVLEASAHVKREDFFLEQHRLVFSASQALAAEGHPIDLVTLTDTLHRQGKLEAAGGAAYVAAIVDGQVKVTNIAHYAKIVREAAQRRRIIYACARLEEAAMKGEEDAAKLLQTGASEFLSMMSQDGEAAMPSTWREAVYGAMDKTIEALRHQNSVMRIFCGIPKIDDMTAGFRRNDVVLIVGQTSHGKSLLASQYATHSDDAGYKGLIFSAEMSKESLALRELAHSGNVPLYLLRRPELIHNPERVIEDMTAAAARESKRSLLVVDQDVTPKRVWSLSEMVKRSKGLDFVIVDYDQLVIRAALGSRDDEFKAQARFMADALALAKRLNICFILLCQPHKLDDEVSRGKRPPRIEQIFGSASVANTAHHVLWIVRKFFQTGMDPVYERSAMVYVLKARNDKTGKVDIGFAPDTVLFTNDSYEPEHKEPSRAEKKRQEREKQKEMEL